MDYLTEIKRSPCLKEFFEFVFRADVESAYNQLCEYGATFEFKYESESCDSVQKTDSIDYVSVRRNIECDPFIPAISYIPPRLKVHIFIHSTMDNSPNLYIRFTKSVDFKYVEHLVRGISAFSLAKCSNLILNDTQCNSHDLIGMSLTWISNMLAYDVMCNIEEYAMKTDQFDTLFDLCNSRDDVYLKAALLNAHNKHPNAYESEIKSL